jgi:signal transduction histidine kinase
MASRRQSRSGELYFGIDARHIRQLGQELVGDRTTAVTELVKNAYDADATTVELRFLRAGRKEGTLEIEDDGNGMSLEDVQRGWMRISTNAKDVEQRSPRYGRTRAGRKGIGRFATETLGSRLRLRTSVAGEPTALSIDFDWEADYPAGKDLGEIANAYRLEPALEEEHGTILRIEGLYEAWGDDARGRVRKAIRLLEPPFPLAEAQAAKQKRRRHAVDPGFRVNVEVNGRPDHHTLRGYDDFRQAGTARVHAKVTKGGRLVAHVTSTRFKLDREETLPGRYPKAGAFSLDASYFIFIPGALGGVPMTIAKDMANDFAGIRLYRDGLRVMPYGERDNDWLSLDQLSSRRTTLVPVANLNWFGQISISRDSNDALRDTASREGVVENEAFRQLKKAVQEALVWAATEVGKARRKKVTTSKRASTSRRTIVNRAHKTVERAVSEDLPAKVRDQVLPVIQSAFAEVSDEARESDRSERDEIQTLLDEVELLRVLASLGTSIAVFSHEVRSALTASSAALQALVASDRKASAKSLKRAHRAVEELQDLAGYIDAYVSASQRRLREPQPMARLIEEFTENLSQNLARNIAFTTKVTPRSLRTAPMARSELEAVLINLLTNAVKAMDGEDHPERCISISAQGRNGDVRLRFQDTGAGIDPKIRHEIFDAFVTDTRSQISELGTGTGLGLKIVRDIVEENGGTIAIGDPDTPFTTCMEIVLPRWKRQKGGS